MSRRALIVDCETTSLVPSYADGRGVIWELAVIDYGSGEEHLWRMKPDASKADAAALTVGKFYERTSAMCQRCTPSRAHDLVSPLEETADLEWSDPAELAAEVALLLSGTTLIAANPTFDAGFLAAFLNHHEQAATWHYRLRDIGSMAWAWLHGISAVDTREPLPLDASTDDLAFALGLDLGHYERHSALGDCRLVKGMLDAIQGNAS